jgi:hypothetical protein
MSQSAKKSTQELPACGMVERLKRFNDDVEKIGSD